MSAPPVLTRFAALQKDLSALGHAFAETPEQKGGSRALSGFVYQMQAALLALLKAWTANPGHFRSNPDLAPLLVETLSDYTELGATAIVCCQVKRTLRPKTARKALEEFWLILQIAKGRKLQIVDLLRFRIVHRFREREISRRRSPPGGRRRSRTKLKLDGLRNLLKYEMNLTLPANFLRCLQIISPQANPLNRCTIG